MREVSCRAMSLVFHGLDVHGVPHERLVKDTGLSLDHLKTARERLAWDDFAQLLERFEALVGPEALTEVGTSFYAHGGDYLTRMAGFALSERQLYQLMTRVGGNLLFSVIESDLHDEGDHLRVVLRIPEPYRDCPAYFRISQGAFTRLPTLIGLPPSRVDLQVRPRCGTFVVPLQRRRGRLRRLPRYLLNKLAGGSAIDELGVEQRRMRESMLELRRTRDALAASEARWRALIESAPDIVVALNAEGRIESANRSCFGPAEAVVGQHLGEMAGEDYRRALEAVYGRGVRAMVEGTGPGGRTMQSHLGPIWSGDEVVGAVMVSRDVTEARRAAEERVALERRVAQAQKIEGLGVLAGGIAHDFNNLLMTILGNTELAQMSAEEATPLSRYLHRIHGAARRAADLTSQMLSYAGRQEGLAGPVDLAALADELRGLVAATLPDDVQLQWRLAPDLPPVLGDEGQLQQVLLNLITNASEACGDAPGRVRVAAEVVAIDLPRPVASEARPLPPGRYVVLTVTDDGCGMDERTVDRMFDPFFSTRSTGRGLGLAAVLGILRSCGGGVEVTSEVGQGTMCTVWLPSAEGERPRPASSSDEAMGAGEGTVLVVDDEPLVRETAREVLEASGYRVLEAEDGQAALELFEEHGDRIDAVLLDVVMPGVSGLDVCRAIHSRHPDARVVLSTGYDRTAASQRPEDVGACGLLRKPYGRRALLQVVGAALQG